jgi:hypothetical protein
MTMPIPARENLFRKLKMFAKILAFFGLSSCALPTVPGEGEKLRAAAKKDEMGILFIGNSYSFGVPAAFRKLAESNGKDVRIGHSTYGGWTLVKHMSNPPTLKKLREGDWDVVVIQEYSLGPSKKEPERVLNMDPGVQFFAAEARAIGAVPLLYQTWGRRDGDPGIEDDDFYKMNRRVRHGYRAASRNAGGVAIVPAGDAWESEFRARKGRELYVEDGSHPSAFGNEVTAKEFYRVIYGG